MTQLHLAFILGFFGSLHCAVMCGPLMLSLPFAGQSRLTQAGQLFLYQTGRILIYTLLGSLAGLLGSSVKLLTNQQTLSMLIGILLILFTLLHFTGRHLSVLEQLRTRMITPISKWLGKVYGLRLWGLYAGMLNGLIPCGMVYLALATALHEASAPGAAAFMLVFGVGTAPLMLLISLGGIYVKRYIRFNANALIPWFMLFMGALFVLRSADLGIPFLSPHHHIHHSSSAADCR